MDQATYDRLRVKSKDEIVRQLVEIVHRHRRRYLRKYLRPCPANCERADVVRGRATGCGACGSPNPERCFEPAEFVPLASKEDLDREFRADLRDPEVLRREYRDVTVLLWVLGAFDGPEVDERVLAQVEIHKAEIRKAEVRKARAGRGPDSGD